MKIIQADSSPSGARPPLLDWDGDVPPEGFAFIPDEFVSVFYPVDKEAAGFVKIKTDGQLVTSCEWDEVAYKAYMDNLPEPDPTPPSTYDQRLTAVEEKLMATEILLGLEE